MPDPKDKKKKKQEEDTDPTDEVGGGGEDYQNGKICGYETFSKISV